MVFSLNQSLEGKKAVVTGASSGIGLAISRVFALAGAHVIMVARNKERLDQSIAQIQDECPSAQLEPLVADLNDPSAFEKSLREAISKWEAVDILVNNAGVTRDGLLMKMSDEDWDSVMSVNLTSAFRACRLVCRNMMRKKSGSIINITSVTALMGNPGQVNYAASKAGMIGLTKSLAKELGSRRVRVNAIAPGFVSTKMTDQLNPGIKEQYKTLIPQGRFGTPEEIANTAWFLASELSSYMTGQVLVVDGGMFMS